MCSLWVSHNSFHVAICAVMETPTFNRIPCVSYELVHIAIAIIKFHGAKLALFSDMAILAQSKSR